MGANRTSTIPEKIKPKPKSMKGKSNTRGQELKKTSQGQTKPRATRQKTYPEQKMINLENFDGKVSHEEEGKAGNPEVNVVIREFRAGGSAPTEKLLSTSYLPRSMAAVDNHDPSDDIAMVSAHAHTSNKEYSSPQVLDT